MMFAAVLWISKSEKKSREALFADSLFSVMSCLFVVILHPFVDALVSVVVLHLCIQ